MEKDTKVYDDYQALKNADIAERMELAEAYRDRTKNPEKYRALRRKQSQQATQDQRKRQKEIPSGLSCSIMGLST